MTIPTRILIAILAALLAGCSTTPTPHLPTPSLEPLEPLPVLSDPPLPDAAEADPARDLGAGKPGAYCATSRLGKHFTKNGTTYVCKGPRPYRWRRAT